MLPTLRFSRDFVLFLWNCGFLLKTCGLLAFWACFNWNLLVFLGLFFADFCFSDCFFFKFYGIFLIQFAPKNMWVCFCENLVILSVFFRICHHPFLNNLLSDFSFCCIFLPTHVGLVFGTNYLFLACFSYFTACFCKITWNHCTWSSETRLRVKRRVSCQSVCCIAVYDRCQQFCNRSSELRKRSFALWFSFCS